MPDRDEPTVWELSRRIDANRSDVMERVTIDRYVGDQKVVDNRITELAKDIGEVHGALSVDINKVHGEVKELRAARQWGQRQAVLLILGFVMLGVVAPLIVGLLLRTA